MMLTQACSKNWYWFILFIVIVVLTLIKLPFFNLPFYWDEAWSYAMAVFDMADKGPTLIPGHANEWFTRGHPLLYYFTASLWLKVFGANVLSAHIFSFLISVIALVICFYAFAQITGRWVVGLFVSIALMVQSVFLTQSTMLLPEIFVMMLGLLTLYFYYKSKWLGYLFAASALVLTKETGLVFIAFVLFDKIFLRKIFFLNESEKNKQFLKETIIVFIPFLVFLIFVLVQKIQLGYFLFPEHTGMLVTDPKTVWSNFQVYAGQLIWGQGRNIWSIVLLLFIVWASVKKVFDKNEWYLLTSVLLFIIAYLLFSSINFFTTRYLLSVIPWYFFIVIVFIYRSLADRKWLFNAFIVILLLINTVITFTLKGEGDTVLTYRRTVELHKQAVNYCESQGWHEKKIFTGFLMQFNLKHPHLGYLEGNKPVGQIVSEDEAEVLIFYSNEPSQLYDKFKNDSNYITVKRFGNREAWVEIIKKK
ncbi:MAG: glycosyltransferase family 39 protein [Bacteroidales bacterium]|nr:glycosyltransferase family 39 protein [Bacteroidales bacterium]